MKRQVLTLAGALGLAAVGFTGYVLAEVTEPPVTFVMQQPADEWMVKSFLGQSVHDASGQVVGDIKDLAFDRQGHISTIVIGVGGFLGMGEKSVGVSYTSLAHKTDAKGEQMFVVAVSKDSLSKAPEFKSTEKTVIDKAKE